MLFRSKQAIACVYQSTRYSSSTTLNAACDVARGIGADMLQFDVEPMVQGYTAMVGKSLHRALTWEQDDLALQNIQARARAPGVWMLTNLRNALLLSTSNRSEAAVGYATMDGDTCGGLAPIAGIDKHFLRHWLRWMQLEGPAGVGPVPELAAVNQLAPTAELRPAECHQTDEADLMPYDLSPPKQAFRWRHSPFNGSWPTRRSRHRSSVRVVPVNWPMSWRPRQRRSIPRWRSP